MSNMTDEIVGTTIEKVCDVCKVVFSVTVRSSDLQAQYCVFCGLTTRDRDDPQERLAVKEVPAQ